MKIPSGQRAGLAATTALLAAAFLVATVTPDPTHSFGPAKAFAAGNGNGGGQRGQRQQQADGSAAGGGQSGGQQGGGQSNFAPPSAPVLQGQTRIIWVLGQDGKLQSRRIKVGLTDGASTEVLEGNLQEGEMVVTGQTLSSANRSTTTNAAPGFGGGQRPGAPGGGGRRN